MSDVRNDNVSVIAPPPAIYAGPLLIGLILHKVRPARLGPRWLMTLLGWPLLVAGVALSGWFIVTMRRADTPIDPRQPVVRLLTGGPFQLSRNPAYTSFALIYTGVASVANTRWPVFFLPGVLAVMQRGVIEREERYLERAFGDEYRRYKAHVRRWL